MVSALLIPYTMDYANGVLVLQYIVDGNIHPDLSTGNIRVTIMIVAEAADSWELELVIKFPACPLVP